MQSRLLLLKTRRPSDLGIRRSTSTGLKHVQCYGRASGFLAPFPAKGRNGNTSLEPQPCAAIQQASVWLLAYPGSVITRRGETVIASWGDRQLWDALNEIGIDLLHTGPVNRAGGIKEREYTPTVDGQFDPISFDIDPELGSEKEYRRMVQVAKEHHGIIAGDLVPLHAKADCISFDAQCYGMVLSGPILRRRAIKPRFSTPDGSPHVLANAHALAIQFARTRGKCCDQPTTGLVSDSAPNIVSTVSSPKPLSRRALFCRSSVGTVVANCFTSILAVTPTR